MVIGDPMTDPIKEQAEGLRYLFYGGRCYRIMPEGSSFTAKKSEMLNVSKAIETHIREKESLESQLAEAKAELSRLRNYCTLTYGFSHPEIKKCSHEMELEEERQLADELAETLNYIAKYVKPNRDGYYYITTALSKHKKRRGEA